MEGNIFKSEEITKEKMKRKLEILTKGGKKSPSSISGR